MSPTRLSAIILGILCLVFSGCAPTQQARKVEPSGFLGDYSMLEEGGKGEALLVYRNPEADFLKYSKILLEPVTIWRATDSDLGEIPEEEAQNLGNLFNALLKEHLEKDYEIVTESGHDVMRIRVALTEAQRSSVPLDIVTTIVPQFRLLSGIKKLATGTHAFVGKVSAEGEVIDSVTGIQLMAAVDRRAGARSLKGITSSWSDVEKAMEYWAVKFRTRLLEERGR